MAAGSGTMVSGLVAAQGLRFVLQLIVARMLGDAAFGLFATVTTVILVAMAFATVGLNNGIIAIATRHRTNKDWPRFKGTLTLSFKLVFLTATLAFSAVFCGAWWTTSSPFYGQTAGALLIASPTVLVGTLSLVVVGALWAVRDLRSVVIGEQFLQQGALIGLTVLFLALGWGIESVLLAFCLSYVLSLVFLIQRLVPQIRHLFGARGVAGVEEPKPLLAIALPQTVSDVTARLILQLDVLVLAYFASQADVGHYRAATSFALMGHIIVSAFIVIYKPVVSELLTRKDHKRLNELSKVMTRWLLILAAPVSMTLVIAPQLILSVMGKDFTVSASALQILILGQVVHYCFALSLPVLMMSDHAWRNMIYGVVSVGLNLALNVALIPDWGIEGAAIASAISLSTWATLRTIDVYRSFGVLPISRRAVEVIAFSILLTLFVLWCLGDAPSLFAQTAAAAAALAGFALIIGLMGLTPLDREVMEHLTQKVRGILGRA